MSFHQTNLQPASTPFRTSHTPSPFPTSSNLTTFSLPLPLTILHEQLVRAFSDLPVMDGLVLSEDDDDDDDDEKGGGRKKREGGGKGGEDEEWDVL